MFICTYSVLYQSERVYKERGRFRGIKKKRTHLERHPRMIGKDKFRMIAVRIGTL
jgi:hypothetical protein